MSFEIEIGSARDTLITEICDAWAAKNDSHNSLVKRVVDDVRERIEWELRNNVEDPRDFDIDIIDDLVRESLNSIIIYTKDIHGWWDEFGNPEPNEFEMASTISDSITWAVFEAASDEISTTLDDVFDDFAKNALDAAFIPDSDDLA